MFLIGQTLTTQNKKLAKQLERDYYQGCSLVSEKGFIFFYTCTSQASCSMFSLIDLSASDLPQFIIKEN